MSQSGSRRQQREAQHQTYRSNRHKFFTKAQKKSHGGGAPGGSGHVTYVTSPSVYEDGLRPSPARARYSPQEKRDMHNGVYQW